jgi:asparagine synthase (glutamine-hydrolysing)
MCGIFALLNNEDLEQTFIEQQFSKGKSRGPEFSILKSVMIKASFGFHRLAINGLNDYSNQPIVIDDIALICNGEIYNHKKLYEMMEFVEPETDSDCEVIIHLYKHYGIEQCLKMLDGVFSFVLMDYRICNSTSKIYVARDPYGVRPLYILKSNLSSEKELSSVIGFASELKVLSEINYELNNEIVDADVPSFMRRKKRRHKYTVEQFQPGTYSTYDLDFKVNTHWETHRENESYHSTGFTSSLCSEDYELEYVIENIQYYLTYAVEKRCMNTERPVACLLSGGLDSSLITALVNEYHIKNNLPTLETYSIGLEGSEDLKYAKMVAEHLGTKHTEVVLTEQEFLDAIPDVIKAIESYDTTSVRASIGNWLLGKYISQHSEAKVIFNGDGSDELLGGYLYMSKAPDMIEFDRECRRLLKDIHAFDVLRSDKSISSHGLEPRTPFLDRSWVQFYLSLPASLRFHRSNGNIEKYLLRFSFSDANYLTYSNEPFETYKSKPLLPDEVLWRKKEAFSDGVSKTTRSLYQIIQEHTNQLFYDNVSHEYSLIEDTSEYIQNTWSSKYNKNYYESNRHLIPRTTEQYYYRVLFENYYPGLAHVVPYFWMPKYVDATDASARTLSIYTEEPYVDEKLFL